MPTRRERAYHEAGHCIASHAAGKRIELVSIDGTGPLAGFCLAFPPGTPEFSEEDIRSAMPTIARSAGSASQPASLSPAERDSAVRIALAGPEAERIHTGRYDAIGHEFDLRKARDLLGAHHRSAFAVCGDLADARERTRTFLRDHWGQVDAVAVALNASGTLTGRQVRLLLGAMPAEDATTLGVAED